MRSLKVAVDEIGLKSIAREGKTLTYYTEKQAVIDWRDRVEEEKNQGDLYWGL
jgi:hypothetical protein